MFGISLSGRTSRASRTFLLALPCLLSAGLLTRPAYAGYWQISVQGSGVKKTTTPLGSYSTGTWDTPPSSYPPNYVAPPGIFFPDDGAYPMVDYVRGDTQGSGTLICTWQPSFPGDPVPAGVTVDVTSTVIAQDTYSPSTGTEGVTLWAVNAFGSPVTQGDGADPSNSSFRLATATATGTARIRLQTSGSAQVSALIGNVAATAIGLRNGGSADVKIRFSTVLVSSS